jgi:amino acid adenylation domain-containing protein
MEARKENEGIMAFSLFHLLAQTAERWPERTALRFAGDDLSYEALVQRSAAMAGALLDLGAQRQDRVAVYLDRSFESMAAIFGVMQAGGAYVPFDSFAPPARLAAILDDCAIQVLITEEEKLPQVRQMLQAYSDLRAVIGVNADSGLPVETLSWDDLYRTYTGLMPEVGVIEQDLCLIFYTSGSTGVPKGVAHSHRSMLSNVEWALEKFGIRPDDRVSNVTSHHFDLSWFEMFVSMGAGAALVMVPEQTVRFPADLAHLIGDEWLSVWCSVPSVLIQLVQRGNLETRDLSSLRWVLFAGERFPTKHLRRLMSLVPNPRYCNMYGTTETHIAAYYDVPPLSSDDPLPIGRACSHVNLMAVSPSGGRAGPGETGELVIRGPSLMEGYWGQPEKTEAALGRYAFGPELESLCYRSGDLVQLRSDGTYQIIGRADRRVKVRGYLVDLDGVEAVLLSDPRVQEAAAYLRSSANDETTWVEAAVIVRHGAEITASQLRLHASRTLPIYAVPERVAILPEFPRTGSGKTSRRDLQALVDAEPRDKQEESLSRDGDLQSALKSFILVQLLDGNDGQVLAPDVALLEDGLIDSMGVMRLVGFIEEQFGVHVPNAEIVEENFSDLHAIQRLVERLR